MEKLLEIYQMYELDLHNYLVGELERFGYTVTQSPNEYIVALPKENNPIMLVSHIDTVHTKKPTEKTLVIKNNFISSPTTGLGADDRNGIYAILQLLELGYRPQVLFTHDEEIGGLGAKAFTIDFKKPLIETKFLIELDRKGINDCVFYDCDNRSFIAMIQTYGFVSAWGSYTDIDTISDVWDVASVNLSIGYYNAHMLSEFTLFSGIEYTISQVSSILDNEPNLPFYAYEKKKQTYTYTKKNRNSSLPAPKFKKGDKVKYVGNKTWSKLTNGEIYIVDEAYSYGCYVDCDEFKNTQYASNDDLVKQVVLTDDDEKELLEIQNDMIVYGYTVTENRNLLSTLKNTYDLEYDKDMKLWHIMDKDDDVS